jgi:hypothetical protein
MIICTPVVVNENSILFAHQPYVYTVKVEIPVSSTDNVVVGFNPCSTLYPEDYGRSNWYMLKKPLNRCNNIPDYE